MLNFNKGQFGIKKQMAALNSEEKEIADDF